MVTPWHQQIKAKLRQMGEHPPLQKTLTGLVRTELAPNRAAMRDVLRVYTLEAANAGGQAAIDKIVAARKTRTREAGLPRNPHGIAPPGPPKGLEAPTAATVTETAFTFNLRDPNLLRAMDKRGTKITGDVTDTMLQDLRDVLAREFYENGKGPQAVANELDDIFPETYAGRAANIARTETGIAQSTTQQEAYARNGVERQQWITLMDDKTRDDHAEMDGVVTALDEMFQMPDGSEQPHPLYDGGTPEENCNCRCDTVPLFEGDEEFTAEELAQPWLGEEEAA